MNREGYASGRLVHPNAGKTLEDRYGVEEAAIIRAKISENHIDVSGANNPRFGAKLTDETKEKIRIKALERSKKKGEKNDD